MDAAKLFSDLESNNPTLVNEAKKRFNELFASSKYNLDVLILYGGLLWEF